MENKNIILILLVIVVILLLALGVMMFNHDGEKQATNIKITSDKTLKTGDDLSIKLTDLNKTGLSKQKVNVTIINKNGKVVVDEVVKTNSKGNAKLDLDLKKGKYTVNVTYGGNDNYSSNSSSQKLKIKEAVTETVSETTNDYPEYNPDLGYYRSTGMGEMEMGVVELASGRYVVVAGDGYYEYGGLDSQGNIITGDFLGHGGQRIY